MKKSSALKLAGVVALIALIVISANFLPVREILERLETWKQGAGIWGPIVLGALYIPITVIFFPGSIYTLTVAALLNNVPIATAAVLNGATLGAAAAFWIGRTLARDWVASKVAKNPRFKAIDEAVGKQGFKIVLLTRLSPVFPFNMLNYAYGITRVRFRDYILATWIGMLPGALMYVYIGTALASVAEIFDTERKPTVAQQIFFVAGLIATIAVTVYVTRVARRALANVVPEGEAKDDSTDA